MMILWVVIIGVLVYVLLGENLNIKAFQRKSAVDYLKERLARGEITTNEYQELKNTLEEERK
jgi:uncharacterized membrane protein